MAVVYDSVKGMPIPEAIAHQEDVQEALQQHVEVMATKAEHQLSAHRHQGHARIMVEAGDIDRHLILDDSRGLLAAMSIEYGRKNGEDDEDRVAGLFILHRATGLPVRSNR